MSATTEPVIKIILMAVLVIAGLLYWLIPKSSIARHFKLSEPLYMLTAVIGMICGVLGLILTFVDPEKIIELHLWELILVPFVLVYVYWGIARRAGGSAGLPDEKQEHDMTKAAATTWALSIPAMALLFVARSDIDVANYIWLPYYLFVTILIYSASTLIYFKRA
jgi:hypothetical protein